MPDCVDLLRILVIVTPWIKIKFFYIVDESHIPMEIKEMDKMGGRLSFCVMRGLTEWGRFFKRSKDSGWIFDSAFSLEEIAGIVDRLGDVYDLDPDKM